jgi:hypothetical protein
MKLINVFLIKKANYVKRQDFFQNVVLISFLWSRYETGTEIVTFQKSEPEP